MNPKRKRTKKELSGNRSQVNANQLTAGMARFDWIGLDSPASLPLPLLAYFFEFSKIPSFLPTNTDKNAGLNIKDKKTIRSITLSSSRQSKTPHFLQFRFIPTSQNLLF
jgi:hypothetical protein